MNPNQISASKESSKWEILTEMSGQYAQNRAEVDPQLGEKVHALEDFFYDAENSPANCARQFMTDAVGACIDIKPTTYLYVESGQGLNLEKLLSVYNDVGLEAIVENLATFDDPTPLTYVYAGKDKKNVERLRDASHVLYTSNSQEELAQKHREIGKLLGYPENDVEYFAETISQPTVHSFDGFRTTIKHDPEHIADGFRQYEAPIYNVMQKFAPKAYQEVLADPEQAKIDKQKLEQFKKQKTNKLKQNLLSLFRHK